MILDGPNKLDARGVPGLGLVITLVSLCTCTLQWLQLPTKFCQLTPVSRQVQTLAPSGLVRYTVYSESRMDCWECGESASPFQSTVTCHLSQAQVGDRYVIPESTSGAKRQREVFNTPPRSHALAASSCFLRHSARNYSLAQHRSKRRSRVHSTAAGM